MQRTKLQIACKNLVSVDPWWWLANSPDLNPIENLLGILKQQVYENECQFRNKKDLWQVYHMELHQRKSRNWHVPQTRALFKSFQLKNHISFINQLCNHFWSLLISINFILVTVFIQNNLYVVMKVLASC